MYLFNVQRIYAFFVSYSMYKLVFGVFILLWWFPNGGVVELVITGGGFFLCHIFCSGGVSLWKFCCWWSWIGWVVALCVGAILVHVLWFCFFLLLFSPCGLVLVWALVIFYVIVAPFLLKGQFNYIYKKKINKFYTGISLKSLKQFLDVECMSLQSIIYFLKKKFSKSFFWMSS